MVKIEEIAKAALAGNGLRTRSLVQDFLRENPHLVDVPLPDVDDVNVLAVAASLLELFASRFSQKSPAWTKEVGPVPEPIFLVKSTINMKRLRTLCETSSPAPLRKRKLYAPPNYLEFV
jgi:hypothetical protein